MEVSFDNNILVIHHEDAGTLHGAFADLLGSITSDHMFKDSNRVVNDVLGDGGVVWDIINEYCEYLANDILTNATLTLNNDSEEKPTLFRIAKEDYLQYETEINTWINSQNK